MKVMILDLKAVTKRGAVMISKKNGFTLVELLAVIVIVGLLFSFSTIAITRIKKNQDVENAKNVISGILTAAKRYESDNQYKDVDDTNVIPINTLISEGYTEYDKDKYSDLKDINVEVEKCVNNNNKLKYIIKDLGPKYSGSNGSVNYSDCGCHEQSIGTADKLCKE